MPPNAPPLGQPFSKVYLNRGTPLQDSPRMRRRMAALMDSFNGDDDLKGLTKDLTRKLGVDVPNLNAGPDWKRFYARVPFHDLLDSITYAWNCLSGNEVFGEGIPDGHKLLVRWVNEIFSDENVHYRVDDFGGVHFSPDEEFVRNRAATVANLQARRYANALDAFEKAMAALSAATPNGKAAIRGTFAACEGLFRLMFPRSPRLTAGEVNLLAPHLQKMHGVDRIAQGAAAKLLGSFKEWIEAAHFYRHEPGTEEVAQPPLSLAIYLVSTGASHLRWLAEIDADVQRRAGS